MGRTLDELIFELTAVADLEGVPELEQSVYELMAIIQTEKEARKHEMTPARAQSEKVVLKVVRLASKYNRPCVGELAKIARQIPRALKDEQGHRDVAKDEVEDASAAILNVQSAQARADEAVAEREQRTKNAEYIEQAHMLLNSPTAPAAMRKPVEASAQAQCSLSRKGTAHHEPLLQRADEYAAHRRQMMLQSHRQV